MEVRRGDYGSQSSYVGYPLWRKMWTSLSRRRWEIRLASVRQILIMNEQTRENIDKYCEKFEKDVLGLFDRSYRKGNPAMMTVRIPIPNWRSVLILVEAALCQGVE
jgi:hypothetical protein